LLLGLARETLRRCASEQEVPTVEGCGLPPSLRVHQGCFVTLTRQDVLRGCIGNLEPRWPLWQAVIENTRAAATRDARFPRVGGAEADEVRIEISLLSRPAPVAHAGPAALLEALRPGTDGVLLEYGSRRATFLPQVWDKLPDPAKFMSQLAVKAGLDPEDWRRPEAVVQTYQVEHFAEPQRPDPHPNPLPSDGRG
jgi:AmmeMemoRadiSam system protein A